MWRCGLVSNPELFFPPVIIQQMFRIHPSSRAGKIGSFEAAVSKDSLVPRSRVVEQYLHSPTCLNGIVLN
jgi:hypothetical protein